jgi:hypothetical protein
MATHGWRGPRRGAKQSASPTASGHSNIGMRRGRYDLTERTSGSHYWLHERVPEPVPEPEPELDLESRLFDELMDGMEACRMCGAGHELLDIGRAAWIDRDWCYSFLSWERMYTLLVLFSFAGRRD